MAITCFLIVSTPIAGAPTVTAMVWQPVLKHVFYALIAILVVAPPALGDAGWYSRLMSSRQAVWLGEISYEVFLLHVIVMWVAMSFVLGWKPFTGSMTVLMVASLIITIPLASLLHGLTRRKVRHAKQIDLCQEPPGRHRTYQPQGRDETELATSRR